MRKEELRIGNWVEWEDGDKDTIEIDAVSACGGVSGMSEKGLYITEIKYINPIPLTEEWFIKLGGEKELYQDDEDDYYLVTRHKDFDFIYENDATVFCDIAGVVIPLKYVHQLQNLYYALTGEELKQLEK